MTDYKIPKIGLEVVDVNIRVNDAITDLPNYFEYVTDSNGLVWITKYHDELGRNEITIPGGIAGFIEGSKPFEDCHYIRKIRGSGVLNGSLRSVFEGYQGSSITLEDFNTLNVQDMSYMFAKCKYLKYINLGSKFYTSNVKDMNHAFAHCNRLEILILGDNFITDGVTDMSHMFEQGNSLREIRLGEHFNTVNVKTMDYMFTACTKIRKLNLGDKFNTKSVKSARHMFSGCTSLELLDTGRDFSLEAVDCFYMFHWCNSLSKKFIQDLLGDKFGNGIYGEPCK